MSKEIFPVNNFCRSYWMCDGDNLSNYRSTVDLPSESDIVVIGSGYAGSSCAYYLYKNADLTKNNND
jgi:hypothetical protein